MTLCKTSIVNKTAHVDMFISLRSHTLLGRRLRDVKILQSSIMDLGLVSPLTVTPHEDKFIILDGHKRFAALRRLAFAYSEHDSPKQEEAAIWAHVPYVLFDRPQSLDLLTLEDLHDAAMYQMQPSSSHQIRL